VALQPRLSQTPAATMLIADTETALRSFAAARGVQVTAPAGPAEVAATWLAFYEQMRVEDATREEDTWPDALLFEWGPREALAGCYDACFYLNFTRQFISEEGADDDAMFQLVWQLEYEPSEALARLGHQAEWCDGLPALPSFREVVVSSEVLRAVAGERMKKVEFYLSRV
jgi:hypothetical protein